ncbi:MAG: DUF1015 domain-containing protein [Oscillospiraceae bacterium]|nr:DUF1015 domain-containing protein [Oscillospiraceae bacterium]
MAKIKPFKALRFTDKAGEIRELVCPPYDIINEEQRLALLEANEHNLIRLELPRGDEPYKDAAKTFKEWLSDGIVACDENEGIYLYEERFTVKGKEYSLKGFVSLVRLAEFSEGVVLPHEETLSKAKTDRFNLMTETGCSFSQIYSLFMDEDRAVSSKVEALSAGAPDICFTDGEGVTHSLWCIYDKEAIDYIADKMADKKLYIADGHHRYETALNFARANSKDLKDDNERTNYCMMFLINIESSGLVVFPTHRVLHSLENFDAARLLERCKGDFDILEDQPLGKAEELLDAAAAKGEKAFAFYCGGESFSLMTLKNKAVMAEILEGKSAAYQNLDVSVLHSLVLERLFGIDKENMANQKNLFYTRDISEAISEVKKGTANCAFFINPTLVTEIRDVAAAGEKMPQKSTYFYPKLVTGLVMNKFREPKE